jgi:hypothetical protein
MDRYHDTISYKSAGTPGHYDEATGNWVAGGEGVTVSYDCRYEASSGNGLVPAPDGSRINYSGIVYLPKEAPVIPQGTKVTIKVKRDGEDLMTLTETVLRYFPGRFNARCWV